MIELAPKIKWMPLRPVLGKSGKACRIGPRADRTCPVELGTGDLLVGSNPWIDQVGRLPGWRVPDGMPLHIN